MIEEKEQQEPSAKGGVQFDFGALSTVKDIHTPEFKEDKKAGIYKYGKNNLFPDFLLDIFLNKSGKHRSIIEKKVKMVSGQGFEYDMTDPLAKEFWENARGSHNLDDMSVLCSTDEEVFFAYAYIIRWNEDKTYVSAIDYMPVHKVRKGLNPKTWFVSDNWQHWKKPESNTRKYKEMNTDPLPLDFEKLKPEEQRLHLNQIVYSKNLTIGSDAYPHVSYQPFIHYLLADYQVGKFTLNNTKNNYLGGYHIDFAGEVPEEEERSATKKAFIEEYTDSEGSTIVFTWTPADSTRGTTLTPLPTNGSEDAFLGTDRQIQENVFVAHRVTNPMLFGIRIAGSLGGQNELEQDLAIYQATEISPKQLKIETGFNRLAAINEVPGRFKLKKYSLQEEEVDTEDANSFNNLSPLVATKILDNLTVNEIRKLGGQPPIEGGDEAPTKREQFSLQFSLQFSDAQKIALAQMYLATLKPEHSLKLVLKCSLKEDSNENS